MPFDNAYRSFWQPPDYRPDMGSAATGKPPPNDFIRLYHLCSYEHALSNLNNSRLKVARFTDANDPFELMALDFREREVRAEVRKFQAIENEHMGMICFSEDWTSPLLWSYYAATHTGICLGFDVSKKNVQRINYESKRIQAEIDDGSGDPYSLSPELQSLLRQTKCHEWSYEQERRMFVPLSQMTSEGGLYFRSFDEQLQLAEVILGPKCNLSLASVRAQVSKLFPLARTFKARLAWQHFKVVPQETSVP